MLIWRIPFVIFVAYLALCPLSAQAQQIAEETISLNGINLSLGMKKSEVINFVGKEYLVQHYGGKEDIWRIFKRGGKFRAGTTGSMVGQLTFKDDKVWEVYNKRGDGIASLLAILEEYNRRGQFIATIKTNFLGHGKIDGTNEIGTAQSIVMSFGKKYIIVIVSTFKGHPEITEVNEVLGE
jgi:hypothetical protein